MYFKGIKRQIPLRSYDCNINWFDISYEYTFWGCSYFTIMSKPERTRGRAIANLIQHSRCKASIRKHISVHTCLRRPGPIHFPIDTTKNTYLRPHVRWQYVYLNYVYKWQMSFHHTITHLLTIRRPSPDDKPPNIAHFDSSFRTQYWKYDMASWSLLSGLDLARLSRLLVTLIPSSPWDMNIAAYSITANPGNEPSLKDIFALGKWGFGAFRCKPSSTFIAIETPLRRTSRLGTQRRNDGEYNWYVID